MLTYFVGERVKVRKFIVSSIYDSLIDYDETLIVHARMSDLQRLNGLTEAAAREGLTIELDLPNRYINHVELAVNVNELMIGELVAEELEFDGKVQNVTVDGFEGALEIDSNQDMKVDCRRLTGSLALNQVAAVSRLTLPQDFAFVARKRGLGNSLYFEEAGQRAEDFSDPDAQTVIELNGMKSELFICR